MHPLEIYLEELRALRSSGAAVKEASGYGALANLLNTVGSTLRPKVRCFIHVKNSVAGLPDGGLFTPDQIKNTDNDTPLLGIPQPSRGVIEVKATDADLNGLADTKQIRDYVKHYGQVLVTNYRGFLLVKRGDNGIPVHLKPFQLAADKKSFWIGAAQPRKAATELGEGIGIGTAIATLVRSSRREEAQTSKKNSKSLLTSAATGEIQFRHLWGKDKRAELLATLAQPPKKIYARLKPSLALGLSFTPGAISADYLKWPALPNLFWKTSPGVNTSLDLDLIEIDLPKLRSRMENYFDEEIPGI